MQPIITDSSRHMIKRAHFSHCMIGRQPNWLIQRMGPCIHMLLAFSAHSARGSGSDYDDLLRKPKHSVTIDLSPIEVMVGVDAGDDQ